MTTSCPSCGQAVTPNAKFCSQCGAVVTAGAANGTKTTGMRDTFIVIGALAAVAAGYFILRRPAPKPEPEPEPQATQQMGGNAQHPPMGDGGMPTDMPQLANLPKDYAGLVDAGNQNMDHQEFALAAECYRRALQLDSSSANVRSDYGACLHGMGLPQRAIDEFRKVLKQDPTHAICSFNLGIVFNELKQVDSAKFYFKKYLKMAPTGEAAEAAKKGLKELGG